MQGYGPAPDGGAVRPVAAGRALRSIALAAAVALLLALRYPSVVLTPRFLAEEGDVFFANAWFLPGAEALWSNLTPRLGYLNLFPILVTWLAAKLASLEFAPTFALLAIGAVQGSALALALAGPRRDLSSPLARAAAAGVLLFFPYHNGLSETWLSVMNAPVHFGVVALMLVLSDERAESRALRIAARTLLALGAATGPYTLVLLPVFAWKWWRTREREALVRTAILGFVAVLQVSIAVSAFAAGRVAETRVLGEFGPNAWYVGVLFQLWCAIAGELPARLFLAGAGLLPGPGVGWGRAAAMLAIAALVVGGAWHAAARTPTRTLLALAALLWYAFTCAFAVKGYPAYRYVVCPSVAIGLLFVHAAVSSGSARPVARTSFALLALLGVLSGIAEALLLDSPMRSDRQAHWRDEIAQWRRDPDHRVRVWPSSLWFTHLADPARRDALVEAVARMPAKASTSAGGPPVVLGLDEHGLPAYFALRFEACATHGSTLLVEGRSSRGDAAFAQRFSLQPGCSPVRVNAMQLAFAGFRDFSAITRIEATLDGAEGAGVGLGDFRVESPVLSVSHPWSGD